MRKLSVADGKYTIIMSNNGCIDSIKRHNEPWDREFKGDGLLLAMAHRIEALEDALRLAEQEKSIPGHLLP